MNKAQLITELSNFDLVLKPINDTQWTIGTSCFANIIMAFNPLTPVDEYNGGVTIKVINAKLYTGEQIKGASEIVHRFLMTPIDQREIT